MWSWTGIILATLATIVASIYLFFQYQFQYWKKRNVPYLQPSFPFGTIRGATIKVALGDFMGQVYQEMQGQRYIGGWLTCIPSMFIKDPELIKHVLVKDFNSFHDRGVYVNKEKDPLGAHLFSIGGPEWRNLRVKLTPTFTSGKMKYMFQTIADIGAQLQDYLQGPAKRNEILEVKTVLSRFTMDVITSCAFGIDSNSMNDPDSIYLRMGKKFFPTTKWEGFKQTLIVVVPQVARLFKLVLTPKDVEQFFIQTFQDTVKYRKQNKIERKDFMEMLIKLMDKGFVDDADNMKNQDHGIQHTDTSTTKFTLSEAAAQAFVFFIAGFETSSTTMQWALYELALIPDVQERLRKEIREVLAKHEGKLTYEAIYQMDYLDRVVSETLRKFPAIPTVNRQCSKTFNIPGTDHYVEPGINVTIPVIGLHHDPKYYPNPEKFDPDRFLPEEVAKRHHYTYLPFGEGPRMCIGNRFGLLQTKVGLVSVVSKYKVEVCEKTSIPMLLAIETVVVTPKDGMHLRFKIAD